MDLSSERVRNWIKMLDPDDKRYVKRWIAFQVSQKEGAKEPNPIRLGRVRANILRHHLKALAEES